MAERRGVTLKGGRDNALVAETRLPGPNGDERVVLAFPITFMNDSGQAVSALVRRFRIESPEQIIVVQDELDLPPGELKIKAGGGLAGHNGLRSTEAHIGNAFRRVRLGIGHPGHKDAVAAYVLHDFAKADQDWLDDLLRGISDGAVALAAGDSAKFLNAVALRTAPARNSGTGTGTGTGAAAAAGGEPVPAKSPAPPAAATAPQSPFDALRGLLRRGD